MPSTQLKDRQYKIDVVIPVYNGANYIISAITSIEKQTYRPNKIIVVDDGSIDDTGKLIRHFHSKIPLEYIPKKNGGLSSARNIGIIKCTSDYIALLDADDEWYPTKLEEQINIFRTSDFSHLGVIYSKYHIINDRGLLTDKYFISQIDLNIRGWIFNKLLSVNKITGSGSGVLIKRECFEKAGLFDEALSACEDWDMWLRIAQYYQFDYIDKTLVKIRRHGQNMQNNESHMSRNKLAFYNKWAIALPEEIDIPKHWIKVIVNFSLYGLPKIDNIKLLNISLSPKAKKRFFITILRKMKFYIFMKIVLFSFVFISKTIYNSVVKK